MAVAETRFRVMASEAHVIVVDGPPQAGEVARRATEELEQAWSRFVPSSDLSRLNASPGVPVAVEPATVSLVETMIRAWRSTAGGFDPTILPALLEAGYRTSIADPGMATTLPAGFRPGESDLAAVVVDRRRRTVTLPDGLAIDPGGIGKGMAADLVVAELLRRGAGGISVSIGGDLATAGTPPRAGGWAITIEDPFDQNRSLGRMEIGGGGVATASTVSRRWIRDGREHHHLIDPATRMPSQTDLAAATVIAPCGWQAEAHATAVLLGGSVGFRRYARTHGLDVVVTTLDGRSLATDRLGGLVAERRPTAAVPA